MTGCYRECGVVCYDFDTAYADLSSASRHLGQNSNAGFVRHDYRSVERLLQVREGVLLRSFRFLGTPFRVWEFGLAAAVLGHEVELSIKADFFTLQRQEAVLFLLSGLKIGD